MMSFRARHRAVIRARRRAEIRRQVQAALEQIRLCEAGDPEALARASQLAGPDPAQLEYARRLEAVAAGEEPGYFGMTPERARAELSRMEEPEPDELEPDEPSWVQRPGESDRAYRRRCWDQEYRAARPMHRRALLLARGFWDAGHELPGPLRRILLGEKRAIRAELSSPRAMVRIGLGLTYRVAEQAPSWAASPTPRTPLSVPGALHALYARRSETWALPGAREPWHQRRSPRKVALAVSAAAGPMPP